VEKQLENADIIIAGNEKLTRKQRYKRFDDWYKKKDKKHWKKGHNRGKKRTIST
jgi:hypothetical protein